MTRNPDTAPASKSIWKGIDRNSFESRVKFLCERAHISGNQDYSGDDKADPDGIYPMPFKLERQLADDIAFICAFEPGARNVTATAIESGKQGMPTIVRIAVNEGVRDQVKTAMDKVVEALQSCASRVTKTSQCEAQLHQAIIQLNCNRILLRLGSKKARLPKGVQWSANRFEPLPQHIRKMLSKHAPRAVRSDRASDVTDFLARLDSAFTALEQGKEDETNAAVASITKLIYNVAPRSDALRQSLMQLGLPSTALDVREIRELDKIAKYWRICISLARMCRHDSNLFRSIRWLALEPFQFSTKSTIMKRQHVHAEIQLITHYEITSVSPSPRAIGASKDACFLCDSFIRAHDVFGITKAHRQIYSIWTVPDLQQYNAGTLRRFRTVLSKVARDVNTQFAIANKQSSSVQTMPLQSTHDLHRYSLPTPSVRTESSARSHDSSIIVQQAFLKQENSNALRRVRVDSFFKSDSPPNIDQEPLPTVEPEDIQGKVPLQAQEPGSPMDETEHSSVVSRTESPQRSLILDDAWIEHSVTQTSQLLDPADWLRISAIMDGGGDAGGGTSDKCRTGYIRTSRRCSSSDVHIIDIHDLDGDREVSLVREDLTEGLRFVLRNNAGETVLIECNW